MSTKIDDYVKAVLSCNSPYDVGKLVNETFPNGTMQLPSDTVDQQIDASLQALNIASHSAAILPLLHARLQLTPKDKQALIMMQIVDLIEHADAKHLQQIVQIVSSVMETVSDMAVANTHMLNDAMNLISLVIGKIQNHPNQLTSMHSMLLYLSLQARIFDACFQIIDQPITDILRENPQPNEPAISPQSVLTYFYYSALIYTAHEEYDRALACFAVPMSASGNALSKIVIDSYKKFLIVSLIAKGAAQESGLDMQCQSQVLNRAIRQHYQAYAQLVENVNKHPVPSLRTPADRQQLDQIINSNRELFAADGNLELVERIGPSLVESSVKSICKAYTNVSLSTLQQKSGCDSIDTLKMHIQSLVNKRQLIAHFDNEHLYIEHVAPSSFVDGMKQTPESTTVDIMSICKLLSDTHAQNKVDPLYVAIAKRKLGKHGCGSNNTTSLIRPAPISSPPAATLGDIMAVFPNANN